MEPGRRGRLDVRLGAHKEKTTDVSQGINLPHENLQWSGQFWLWCLLVVFGYASSDLVGTEKIVLVLAGYVADRGASFVTGPKALLALDLHDAGVVHGDLHRAEADAF
jgi:hypothetical protein